MAADEAGKTHEALLLFLFAGESDFFGIDHDDEIAGIDVRREDGFFFAAQKIRRLDRDAAEDLILGVNDPPLAWNFVGFSGKSFHPEEKGHGNYGCRRKCQPSAPWFLRRRSEREA